MSAIGCHVPGCVFTEGEPVRYCLDCGRAGRCTCEAVLADGRIVVTGVSTCVEHFPTPWPSVAEGIR